jgi:ABC-type polysaccharide/polyol phosphate transport system ATPase subunit
VQADPEILLVDEVLAVGDLPFQEKSYKTFLSLKEKKTIVYVSHNIDSVKKLCDSAIFLDKGKIASYGEPNKVVDDYLRSLNGQSQ